MNDEERASIIARYNYSPEVKALIDLNKVVLNYGGKYISEGTLKYVKQSPFYQKQCVSN